MSSFDSISVALVMYPSEDGVLHEDISLVLNGEKVSGTFDPYTLSETLLLERSEAEILTCSCGNAGCAGIFDGTAVKRRRYTVEWRDMDCGLPKKFYKFKRAEYEAAAAEAIQLMRGIVTRREINPTIEQDYYYAGPLSYTTVREFEKSLERSSEWFVKYNASRTLHRLQYQRLRF